MNEQKYLTYNYNRCFGTEIEINSFNGASKCLLGELPEGIQYVGLLVQKVTQGRVLLQKWDHNHDNDCWIIKPDSSCGMEICSPVSKGLYGIREICHVVDKLSQTSRIQADKRCSLHVHVDVSDLDLSQLARVIQWWIKCEPVFMDSVPEWRKNNRYCQFIGSLDFFEADSKFEPKTLISLLGNSHYVGKYGSLNTFHYWNENRKTIEFRLMDNFCCKNSNMLKNWLLLLLHFVERALHWPNVPYQPSNAWTGWCWLDPKEVFCLLGFDQSLAPLLQEVRQWFLQRLLLNGKKGQNILSPEMRQYAYEQYQEIGN
jgi:hypothetical protein